MSAVGHNDVLVEKVPAGSARRIPTQLPDVDRVAQYVLNGPVLKRIAAVGADAHSVQFSGDDVYALAGQEAVKDTPDIDGLCLVRDEPAILGAVAEGGGGLELPALRVDPHAPLDLLAQPNGVKFVHPLDDTLNEGAEGTGNQRLRHAHHIDTALGAQDGFVEDAFLLVSGEARVFP